MRLRAPVFRGSASRGSAVRRRGTFVVRLSEPGLGSAPQGHSVSELCSGARQCASGAPCFGARASRSSAVRHRSAVFRGSKAHAASSLEASMQGLLAAAPDLHAERGARPEAVQAVPTDNLCACTVDCERQTLWTVTTDNPCARAVDDAIQTTCRAPQKSVALAQRRNPRDPTSTPEVDAHTHTHYHTHTRRRHGGAGRGAQKRAAGAPFFGAQRAEARECAAGAHLLCGAGSRDSGNAPHGHSVSELCSGARQCASGGRTGK